MLPAPPTNLSQNCLLFPLICFFPPFLCLLVLLSLLPPIHLDPTPCLYFTRLCLQGMQGRLQQEKAELAHLVHPQAQALTASQSYRLVPSAFMAQWRAYMQQAGKRALSPASKAAQVGGWPGGWAGRLIDSLDVQHVNTVALAAGLTPSIPWPLAAPLAALGITILCRLCSPQAWATHCWVCCASATAIPASRLRKESRGRSSMRSSSRK